MYLNQLAVWQECETNPNDNAELVYTKPSETIRCRKEKSSKTVVDSFGNIVMPHLQVLVKKSVKEGDKIDGEKVVATEPFIGLGGKEVMRMVYT